MNAIVDTPPGPTASRYGASFVPIAFVMAATLLWCLGCWSLRPAERINQFFREGSPVDLLNSVWLITSATLTWCVWMISAGSPLRRFWLVVAIAAFYLGLDERFQFHELVSKEGNLGPTPFGLRNWSDLVVLLYGVVAVALVLPVLPTLWKERRLRWLGLVAVVLGATSTAIDTLVSSSAEKDVIEESFKVLSGGAIFLTCVEAWCLEVRRRGSVAIGRRLPSALHAVLLFGLCAVLAWVTLGGSDRWHYLVSRYWGSAHSWIVCVLLWSSGLLLLLSWFLTPAGARTRAPFWLILALSLGFLGVGEAVRATRIQVLHDRVIDQLPGSVGRDLAVLHDPLRAQGWLALVLILALALWGFAHRATSGRASRWLLAAALLLPGALLVNLHGGEPGNDLYGPLIRIAGAACVLLGSIAYVIVASGGGEPSQG